MENIFLNVLSTIVVRMLSENSVLGNSILVWTSQNTLTQTKMPTLSQSGSILGNHRCVFPLNQSIAIPCTPATFPRYNNGPAYFRTVLSSVWINTPFLSAVSPVLKSSLSNINMALRLSHCVYNHLFLIFQCSHIIILKCVSLMCLDNLH